MHLPFHAWVSMGNYISHIITFLWNASLEIIGDSLYLTECPSSFLTTLKCLLIMNQVEFEFPIQLHSSLGLVLLSIACVCFYTLILRFCLGVLDGVFSGLTPVTDHMMSKSKGRWQSYVCPNLVYGSSYIYMNCQAFLGKTRNSDLM